MLLFSPSLYEQRWLNKQINSQDGFAEGQSLEPFNPAHCAAWLTSYPGGLAMEDEEECYLIRDSINQLQQVLAENGYAPR